jgi:hypothetical protein
MSESRRIERRVMNGGGPVVLAIEWRRLGDNYYEPHYFLDGHEVWSDVFDRVTRMLALPQGSAL